MDPMDQQEDPLYPPRPLWDTPKLSGWLQDTPDPHEHPLDTPRHFWGIFRPFQKTTGPSEPTKGPPRPSKSSLGHPQTLLDDHSDPHEGSLDPRRLYWDISRSAQRLLRAPGPIVGAARPFQGPTGPTWGLPGSSLDISRLFCMSPEPPGCPQTSLGRLQIPRHDSKWGKGGLKGGGKGLVGLLWGGK